MPVVHPLPSPPSVRSRHSPVPPPTCCVPRSQPGSVDTSPCPAIEGLEKEGKATAKKTDDAIVDGVLLQGAAEVEHHEIGVYENLIINARAMGRQDVARLLEQNLEQERHTLREVLQAEEQMAAATPLL